MQTYYKKSIKNAPVRRHNVSAHSWKLYLVIAIACFMAYAFVSATHYHFSALDLAFQTEEMKQKKLELQAEKQKLIQKLASKTAPQRLDSLAEKQGMGVPTTRQTVAVRQGEPVR